MTCTDYRRKSITCLMSFLISNSQTSIVNGRLGVCFDLFSFFYTPEIQMEWAFLWTQGNASFYLFGHAWSCSPVHKHVRKGMTRIHILPIIYKFNLMGQISEKCVGLKAHKSPLVSWHVLALCALYFSQIIPFVSEDILIPRDLKLPVNQGLNKRPPTVFAVNLLSPF